MKSNTSRYLHGELFGLPSGTVPRGRAAAYVTTTVGYQNVFVWAVTLCRSVFRPGAIPGGRNRLHCPEDMTIYFSWNSPWLEFHSGERRPPHSLRGHAPSLVDLKFDPSVPITRFIFRFCFLLNDFDHTINSKLVYGSCSLYFHSYFV